MLVETGPRIRQPVAAQRNAPLHGIALRSLRCGHDPRIGGHAPARHRFDGQHVKAHLRRAAENGSEPCRILQARQLHQNAVPAHTLDRRLGDPHLVHALPDDFKALFDGRVHALAYPRFRQRQPDAPVAFVRDVDVLCHLTEALRGDRRGKQPERPLRLRGVRNVRQRYQHGLVLPGDGRHADAFLAQHLARIGRYRFEPGLDKRRRIDLQHEMRSAAQIEPQRHLLMRQPSRQPFELRRRENIGKGHEDAQQDEGGIARQHKAR